MPQMHPATVAAHVAMFDQLCRGRFIFGIGPGGLVSDFELFNVGDAELRPPMMLECLDTVLRLWAQDPPYRIDGRFWKINVEKNIYPEFKVGYVPRPFQQPHPPIAISLLTPNSASARTAGERGWIPVSGNFFHRRYLRGHWERYVEGCEAVGRRPDPDVWRVSRSVLVTETDSEAEDYLADPDSGLSFYYSFFLFSFSRLRKALFMVKPHQAMPDEAVTVDAIKRGMIIAGSPRRVLDQLVALRDEIGHFGTGAARDRRHAETRASRGEPLSTVMATPSSTSAIPASRRPPKRSPKMTDDEYAPTIGARSANGVTVAAG